MFEIYPKLAKQSIQIAGPKNIDYNVTNTKEYIERKNILKDKYPSKVASK